MPSGGNSVVSCGGFQTALQLLFLKLHLIGFLLLTLKVNAIDKADLGG